MTARRVIALDGTAWTVRRRWIPLPLADRIRRRWRRRPNTDRLDLGLDVFTDAAEIPIVGAVAAAIAVVLCIVLVVIWFPLLIVIGFEIALLALLAIGGVFARFVFRRPWWIEAASQAERRHWYTPGYRAAGRRRDEIADQFAHGHNTAGDEVHPVTD